MNEILKLRCGDLPLSGPNQTRDTISNRKIIRISFFCTSDKPILTNNSTAIRTSLQNLPATLSSTAKASLGKKGYAAMAPSRTATVKSKHAANKSGIRNSKSSNRPENDGVSKKKAPKTGKGSVPLKGKGGNAAGGVIKKKKTRRIYTEKELNIPALNMITPVGVEKPKGHKKGKVFVDDKVSWEPTPLACVYVVL